MKTIKLISIALIAVLIQSCNKSAHIRIQNNISQVKITDVKWGSNVLSYELLPGQTSEKTRIDKYSEELPCTNKISFKMTANGKIVYLETEEVYTLDKDDDLLIILKDDTKIKNPNK